ncbi:MAG: ABC transporter permease [Spirochaetales bacterium]|nr:ABC transporter permease [Spirochaetales bacterium]
MKLNTASLIAFRSFRRSRRKDQYRSRPLLGALLGVSLSLIPLVAVINISEGMIEGIVNRFLETDSYHLQIFSYTSKTEDDFQAEKEAVLTIPEIKYAFLERKGAGMAYSDTANTGVAVRAVERDIWETDEGFRRYIEVRDGAFDLSEDRSIVLGEAIADKLGVVPGDSVKILTGKVFPNGRYIPRVTPFTVTGIVSSGYQDLDRLWVFIPYDMGWKILSDETSQTLLGIKTIDPHGNLNQIINRIGTVSVGPNWRAYTWEALNRSELNSYQTTRSMLVVIMAMLVLVAVINVSSSLIMLIVENRQSIGVLKCLGASPAGIQRVYRLTGLFVGIGGALLGCGAGLLISRYINTILAIVNGLGRLVQRLAAPLTGGGAEEFSLLNKAYYLQVIPVNLQWDWVITVGIGAALLSWVTSTVPAARAGRIRPLDIIRKF